MDAVEKHVVQISYLADRPEFIETLAPWVCEHWRPIVAEETLATRVAKFRAHLNRSALPIAWVAHVDSQVLGTAALRAHDLPGRDDLTPWLGGMFVAPQFRGRGIGTALCKVVEEKAKDFVEGRTLYLFTLDKQAWYTHLGWKTSDPCVWRGRAGHIMLKKI